MLENSHPIVKQIDDHSVVFVLATAGGMKGVCIRSEDCGTRDIAKYGLYATREMHAIFMAFSQLIPNTLVVPTSPAWVESFYENIPDIRIAPFVGYSVDKETGIPVALAGN